MQRNAQRANFQFGALRFALRGRCDPLDEVGRGVAGKTPDIVLADAQAMGYKIAILPGLLLGGIISVCDELLEDVKRMGKYPPPKGDSSPAKTFARFGSAEWDARRTAFREPLGDPADAPSTAPARQSVPAK